MVNSISDHLATLERRRFLSLLGCAVLGPYGCALPGGEKNNLVFSGVRESGEYAIAGISLKTLKIQFRIPVKGRIHGFARNPTSTIVASFARRPGNFFIVFDIEDNTETIEINASSGRHFYGHGAFSEDGSTLFASENDYKSGRGIVGIYDANDGFKRVGEVSSGGVGPHDILLSRKGEHLVVANGGIRTHPRSGRARLNLDTMHSNISYLDAKNGTFIDAYSLPETFQKLSIRHIDIASDDKVVFACQYFGKDGRHPPLFGEHEHSGQLELRSVPKSVLLPLNNYCGSVAAATSGDGYFVSAPRGNLVLRIDTENNRIESVRVEDGCGLDVSSDKLLISDGQGALRLTRQDYLAPARAYRHVGIQWDNHLG